VVDHVDGDEEISLQMIEPVEVPDAPPADLVPAEGPSEDAKSEGDDNGGDAPSQSGK
jgi:hypothetical protein